MPSLLLLCCLSSWVRKIGETELEYEDYPVGGGESPQDPGPDSGRTPKEGGISGLRSEVLKESRYCG